MAKNTEAEVLEEELSAKQIINEGIQRVIDATGIDVQKNRYKAMRALAFQAFVEAIESDDFDGLVDRALANIDDLPTGWEIEKVAAEKPAKAASKPAAKKSASKTAKAPAKSESTKPAPRRRPTR